MTKALAFTDTTVQGLQDDLKLTLLLLAWFLTSSDDVPRRLEACLPPSATSMNLAISFHTHFWGHWADNRLETYEPIFSQS